MPSRRGGIDPKHPDRQERHSASGKSGRPKKEGAGSKGVWGSIMDQEGPAILDQRDPNYVPPEEQQDYSER